MKEEQREREKIKEKFAKSLHKVNKRKRLVKRSKYCLRATSWITENEVRRQGGIEAGV